MPAKRLRHEQTGWTASVLPRRTPASRHVDEAAGRDPGARSRDGRASRATRTMLALTRDRTYGCPEPSGSAACRRDVEPWSGPDVEAELRPCPRYGRCSAYRRCSVTVLRSGSLHRTARRDGRLLVVRPTADRSGSAGGALMRHWSSQVAISPTSMPHHSLLHHLLLHTVQFGHRRSPTVRQNRSSEAILVGRGGYSDGELACRRDSVHRPVSGVRMGGHPSERSTWGPGPGRPSHV